MQVQTLDCLQNVSLHDDDNHDNAKAITIPRVFSENSQAKNGELPLIE